MELRHIKYFLAVAEELHFRKAAERLFVSQPGLSRQIRQMENELRVSLFIRDNRNVKLTASGEYLKTELEKTIKNINSIFRHAKLIGKGKEGSLRLGYIGSAMHTIIPEFLLKLQANQPNIQVDLREMDNQIQTQKVLSQDIDLGFVRMDRVLPGVNIRPLYEETFSLVLPQDHPITVDSFTDLSALRDESFIMFDASYSPSYHEKVMQIFDEAGFSPHISHKSVKANTIYRLIENNFGIAIVPTSLKEGYNLKIKFIELSMITHRTTLQLIWNSNNQNPIIKDVLSLF